MAFFRPTALLLPESSPGRRGRVTPPKGPGIGLLHPHAGVALSAENQGLKPSKSQRQRPVGSDQGPTAQQDSTEVQSEAAMFDLVLRSSRDELQSIIGNQDATATFTDGLTALSAYMMFVLHYFENHLTTANLHNWPVISHASLRHLSSRQAFTAAVARHWGEIPGTEVAHVVKVLISRFPRPPTIAIGEREIGLWLRHCWQVKCPFSICFCWGQKNMPFRKRACISGNFL